jgi:hypothetical protein
MPSTRRPNLQLILSSGNLVVEAGSVGIRQHRDIKQAPEGNQYGAGIGRQVKSTGCAFPKIRSLEERSSGTGCGAGGQWAQAGRRSDIHTDRHKDQNLLSPRHGRGLASLG